MRSVLLGHFGIAILAIAIPSCSSLDSPSSTSNPDLEARDGVEKLRLAANRLAINQVAATSIDSLDRSSLCVGAESHEKAVTGHVQDLTVRPAKRTIGGSLTGQNRS